MWTLGQSKFDERNRAQRCTSLIMIKGPDDLHDHIGDSSTHLLRLVWLPREAHRLTSDHGGSHFVGHKRKMRLQ